MSRYSAQSYSIGDAEVYCLKDQLSGAETHIWPGFGNNCLSLALPSPDGGLTSVIDDLSFIHALPARPNRYGTPILFPWPGSIPQGRFRFEGKDYQLGQLSARGTADHGFVNRLPWKVVRMEASDSGAVLSSMIDAAACASLSQGYPFDFELVLTYGLEPDGFILKIAVKNKGSERMPFGFGAHPFFTIPLGRKGSRGDCRLSVDVEKRWLLEAVLEPGTFSKNPDSGPFWSDVPQEIREPDGQQLDEQQFNNVYKAAVRAGESRKNVVVDPHNKRRVTVTASEGFETLVVYTPPDRNAMAIEPWTCTVNAFNLAAQNVPNSGLLAVKPGESWNGWMRIKLD